jgi:hypothetical protein
MAGFEAWAWRLAVPRTEESWRARRYVDTGDPTVRQKIIEAGIGPSGTPQQLADYM